MGNDRTCVLLACLVLGVAPTMVCAQSGGQALAAAGSSDARAAQLEKKLEAVSSALASTQQQLQQSQQQIRELQEEMLAIRKQLAEGQTPATPSPSSIEGADAARTTAADIEDLKERQQALEAQGRGTRPDEAGERFKVSSAGDGADFVQRVREPWQRGYD